MRLRAPSSGRSGSNHFPWRWALGGVVSLLCALVLLSRIESAQLVRELSKIDPGRLIIALFMGLCFFPARTWRWQLLFPKTQRPDHRDCFAALAFSNLVNNLVPARGGDLVRCLLVKRSGATGASVALGTLAFEKTLDGLTLALVLMLGVVLLGPPGWVMITAMLPGTVFIGALVFLITLRLRSSWVLRIATRGLEFCQSRQLKERGVGLLSRFIDGLCVIESRGQILAATALTAVIWLGDSMITLWLSHTQNTPMTLGAAAILSAIIGLGYMIPAGPAAVGSYEAAAVAGLGLFDIHGEQALALALVLHGCSLSLTTGLGLVGLVLAAGNASESSTERAIPDEYHPPPSRHAHSGEDGLRPASERPAPVDEAASATDLKETASYQKATS
jgi:uncharacterized protein (TIRG00374 family)